MPSEEIKKRLVAAYALLGGGTTTREKFTSIKTLLKGIDPKLDTVLATCDVELSRAEKYYKGAAIDLILEHLPEQTEEQKKRKKALLLFLTSWNQLKAEVKRVEKELTDARAGKDGKSQSAWSRIFNFAKGPFGIFTLAAAGIVLVTQATSVQVVVKNIGCSPIQPPLEFPIALPGFSLPNEQIVDGGAAIVTMYPVSVRVDGTQAGTLRLGFLGMSYPFSLSSEVKDITFDGASFLGKDTEVQLYDKREHTLVINCLP